MRGISVDGMNPFGRPTVRQLKLLHVTGVRMVAFDEPMWYAYYRELEAAGLDIAVVLTGQSFASNDSIINHCANYARQINPLIWIFGNEWNVSIDATWPPGGDDDFVAFWNGAARAVQLVRPDARLYVGGLYSEPTPIVHLRRVWPRLDPKPIGIDYHPYEEGYEEAGDLLKRVAREFECEVSAMEWNDSDPAGLRRFQKVLDGSTNHSAFFCLDDRMVEGHGVIDSSGRRKPTWYALREAMG